MSRPQKHVCTENLNELRHLRAAITWTMKRVCAFNLFSTCISRGTITHMPRVFHVALPSGVGVVTVHYVYM